MPSTDSEFAGSIPAIYDRYLKPLLFAPYARDIAARTAATRPATILETAAGTGLVTEVLAGLLPAARIVATDLNEPMLEVAAAKVDSPLVEFGQADAQTLPFGDDSFDVLVCQFGVMFFPDRIGAYREAHRVLKPTGHFIFNVWDDIEANLATLVVAEAVTGLFPDDPPGFFRRVPFGYHDVNRVRDDLIEAGFRDIECETIRKLGRAATSMDAAIGLCQGTPLRTEVEARGDLQQATEAVAEALSEKFGAGPIEPAMSAHVFQAQV